MVPVFLSLEYLPQNRRPGIGMFPEVVIADYPGNLGCYRSSGTRSRATIPVAQTPVSIWRRVTSFLIP